VVDTIGLPLKSRKGEPVPELVADAVGRTLDGLSRAKLRDPDAVETAVERAVRSAVQNVWGKKPACHVLVIEV
jgi:ribonuclease J